ncbi:pyridoxal 5'-phosphate synthase [Tunturiibacter empetritectus]|uniref:pyridoxal 5'-phosphate synthase n=1 Tax=Tunturiibacter empetritectus TaxID=3069691 RepID=UPI003D9B8097
MSEIDVERAVDPIALFGLWMSDAEAAELNDPNAVALATATREGVPSVRMVLLKRVDELGFCFYTNAESQKGSELAENPRASMCFHWKSLRRQVRVSGSVAELPGEDADEYFHSRSRLSQLGAAASEQSRVLASREALVERVKELEREFPGRFRDRITGEGTCCGRRRLSSGRTERDGCTTGFCLREAAEFVAEFGIRNDYFLRAARLVNDFRRRNTEGEMRGSLHYVVR